MKLDDDIHNYYEKLLLDHLVELRLDDEYDTEYLADLCCIVLNQLPLNTFVMKSTWRFTCLRLNVLKW